VAPDDELFLYAVPALFDDDFSPPLPTMAKAITAVDYIYI
jgi:hypothetical protein